MIYFIVRRSVLILALALTTASSPATAETHDMITLDCVAKSVPKQSIPYHRVFYIDLTTLRYCEGRCQSVAKLKGMNADVIDLSWESPKGEIINTSSGNRRFYRTTGQFVGDETYSFASLQRYKILGRCTATSLEILPIKKFLNDAQNQ